MNHLSLHVLDLFAPRALSPLARLAAIVVFPGVFCLAPLAADIGVRYIEPPAGAGHISVLTIADEGRLVAGQIGETNTDGLAFFWTAEGGLEFIVEDTDSPRDDLLAFSRVQGSSSDGRFLVGRLEIANGNTVAFRHDRQTGETRLALPPEGTTPSPDSPGILSRATGVSNDGRYMVGQMRVGDQNEAVYWDWDADPDSEGFWNVIPVREALPVPPGWSGDAWAYRISGDGTRVAGFFSGQNPNMGSALVQVGFTYDKERGVRFLSTDGLLHHDPAAAWYGIPAFTSVWDLSFDGSSIVGWTWVHLDDRSVYKATRWDYTTGEAQFLDIPDGWGWAGAYSVSADGSVVAGYVGRWTEGSDGARTREFGGMFWTEETGSRYMTDYLWDEFGYDLGGNRVGPLSVSLEGDLFSGPVFTAAGPKILQIWSSPYRVLHAYPRPGEGEGLNVNRASRDASVLGGTRSVRVPPSGEYPHSRTEMFAAYWTEGSGFVDLNATLIERGLGADLRQSHLASISEDGRFLGGQSFGSQGSLGFWYDRHTEEGVSFPGSLRWLSADGNLGVGRSFGGESFSVFNFRVSPETDGFSETIGLGALNDHLPEGWRAFISANTMSDDGSRVVGQLTLVSQDSSQIRSDYGFTWDRRDGVRLFGPALNGVPVDFSFGDDAISVFSISADGSLFSGWRRTRADGGWEVHSPILWSYDSLEFIELGVPDGYESATPYSKSENGRIVAGTASRSVDVGGEQTFEYTSWVWTHETGVVDLGKYLLDRFGPARDPNQIVGLRISADGKHLYGMIEWGAQTELVRISRPVAWESPMDRAGGELRYRGEGYIESDWLGLFREGNSGWIDHAEHGWLAPRAVGEGQGVFIYDEGLGTWTWTRRSSYPWMFTFDPVGRWVWYVPGGTPEGRWFYRPDTVSWIFRGE